MVLRLVLLDEFPSCGYWGLPQKCSMFTWALEVCLKGPAVSNGDHLCATSDTWLAQGLKANILTEDVYVS